MNKSDYEWHVRRMQSGEGGRIAGEKKIRSLVAELGCKCEIWIPKRVETVVDGTTTAQKEQILFPAYCLIGKPADGWCGECALPIRPLDVDIHRRPLHQSVVALVESLEGEDPGLLSSRYERGQRVMIKEGGLRGLIGRFVDLTTSQIPRAIIQVQLFGERIVDVTMPLSAVEIES